MMVNLSKEEGRLARRQLLADVVYIVCHDGLRQLHQEGRTKLTPAELLLSAREFSNNILSLPDAEEGLADEIADLEDEAKSDDAMIVMMVAVVQIEAMNRRHESTDTHPIIKQILKHCSNHDLFFTLLEVFADKEQKQLDKIRTSLLDYEVQNIRLHGGGSDEIRKLFEYTLDFDNATISGSMALLNAFNNDNGHAYDEEIRSLMAKLKEPKIINADKYIDAHDNKSVTIQK